MKCIKKRFAIILSYVSLRSKRFQSSYSAKVRAGAKKKWKGEGEGTRENAFPSLPSPSPLIPFFFCSSPNFLDKLARKPLLCRLVLRSPSPLLKLLFVKTSVARSRLTCMVEVQKEEIRASAQKVLVQTLLWTTYVTANLEYRKFSGNQILVLSHSCTGSILQLVSFLPLFFLDFSVHLGTEDLLVEFYPFRFKIGIHVSFLPRDTKIVV